MDSFLRVVEIFLIIYPAHFMTLHNQPRHFFRRFSKSVVLVRNSCIMGGLPAIKISLRGLFSALADDATARGSVDAAKAKANLINVERFMILIIPPHLCS